MKAVNSFSIFAAVVMATTASTFGQTYSTLFTPGIPAGPLSLATSWSGLFDGSTPTFTRAVGSSSETAPIAPTALATAGPYRFNQQNFTPTVSGVHNFYSAQAFDGFLHLYSPNFNSAAALTDVLAGDDDMTTLNGGSVPNRNGVTTTEDSGFQFNLTANTPYVVVTSSFTASTTTPAAGAYYNEIYAPSTPATPRSPITTIPDATSSTVPGSQIVIPLSISDLGTVVSLNSVTLLGIDHTFLGDLVIKLRHASSGTTIDLIDRHGKTTASGFGSSADLLSTNTYTIAPTGTALSTTGILATGTYAQNVNTPVGGSSADDGTFASFASLPLNGAWELLVQDFGTGDIGSISGFSINVTIPEPATLVTVAGFAVLALRRRRN